MGERMQNEVNIMSKSRGGRGGGGNNSGRGKATAMKYEIRADIKINGSVQRKDIIGAIMGQTEGLLGDDLDKLEEARLHQVPRAFDYRLEALRESLAQRVHVKVVEQRLL